MLKWREVRFLIKTLKYKPGWTFRANRVLSRKSFHKAKYVNELHIIARVPDFRNPRKKVSVEMRREVPPMKDTRDALLWLRSQIKEFESHETDEFLHFNGVQVFNPHGHDLTWDCEQAIKETLKLVPSEENWLQKILKETPN